MHQTLEPEVSIICEEWDIKQVIALAVVTWATEHNVEDN